MGVFNSNVFPENFINNRFKTFLDNRHRIQEKMDTRKTVIFVFGLPYLEPLSSQTRSKCQEQNL